MSLPMPAAAAVAQGALHPLDAFLATMNTNPYLIGTAMLLLNLGGRFIAMEVTKGQEQFFQNVWVRRFLIFVVLFMGTRNLVVAFWMWLVIVLFLGYLFNENSTLCLFTGGTCQTTEELPPAPVPMPPPVPQPPSVTPVQTGVPAIEGLTMEESGIYQTLTRKLQSASQQAQQALQTPLKKTTETASTYIDNIMALRGAEGWRDMNPRF